MHLLSARALSSSMARGIVLLAFAGAGCGNGGTGGPGPGGDPLPGDPGAWTWVDIPGMRCDDGSDTGIAVNPAPAGAVADQGGELFIYFMGGGACWDGNTCFILNTAVHGPFGRPQWDTTGAPGLAHALDRARQTNPFRNANYVFVPYCTGDLHAGDNVASYDVLGTARPFEHVGRHNVETFLPRVRATWPSPARVVISGSSAGGFGATLNYDLIRRAFPDAQAFLVNDSGPLLEREGIPPDHRAAWYANWRLGDVIDPVCGGCQDDLSLLYPALIERHPGDRMALLTSLQDSVVRAYFLILLGLDFELRLRSLIENRLTPSATFRSFVIPGESHVLLGTPDTIVSAGLTVESWLSRMLGGGAGWSTVGL